MSFSGNVKQELMQKPLQKPCCIKAELGALTQSCASFVPKGRGKIAVVYHLHNIRLAQRVIRLLKAAYTFSPEILYTRSAHWGGYTISQLTIRENESAALLLDLQFLRENHAGNMVLHGAVPKTMLARRCCQNAFLRGAYLGCGTMRAPDKAYYMSFAAETSSQSKLLQSVLKEKSIHSSVSRAGGGEKVLIEQGDGVSFALACMGASNCYMEMENIRIRRESRNQANRAANCDKANLNRQLSAGYEQFQALQRYVFQNGLSGFPVKLQPLVNARLAWPEASLAQLGETLMPPVSKSGVYHQMSKIMRLIRQDAAVRNHGNEVL